MLTSPRRKMASLAAPEPPLSAPSPAAASPLAAPPAPATAISCSVACCCATSAARRAASAAASACAASAARQRSEEASAAASACAALAAAFSASLRSLASSACTDVSRNRVVACGHVSALDSTHVCAWASAWVHNSGTPSSAGAIVGELSSGGLCSWPAAREMPLHLAMCWGCWGGAH